MKLVQFANRFGPKKLLRFSLFKLFGVNPRHNRFQNIESFAKDRTWGSFAVHEALVDSVVYAFGNQVEGGIAEFGTMTGCTAVCLAAATSELNARYRADIRGNKELWFFDSFEGLPGIESEVDARSPHVLSNIWSKGSCKGLSVDEFERLVRKTAKGCICHVKVGWFSETARAIPKHVKFSVIHIDGDLYASALDALNGLFGGGHVAEGAIILFDDFNCNRSDPDLGERLAWRESVERFNILFSDFGSYGVSGWKFIIHGYRIEGTS